MYIYYVYVYSSRVYSNYTSTNYFNFEVKFVENHCTEIPRVKIPAIPMRSGKGVWFVFSSLQYIRVHHHKHMHYIHIG